MIWLDGSIVLLISLATLLGYRDGFLRKTIGILSFLLALIVATKLMPSIGRTIAQWLELSMEISYVLAFGVVFLGIVVTQILIYRIVGRGDDEVVTWNRIAGGLLGLFQGSLAVSLLLLMLSIFDAPSVEARQRSMLYKPVLNLAPRVFDLTLELFPRTEAFYEKLRSDLEHYQIFD